VLAARDYFRWPRCPFYSSYGCDELGKYRQHPSRPRGPTFRKTRVLSDRLSRSTKEYLAIENMPTWPIEPKTRRRFAVRIVVLFLPVLKALIPLTGIFGKSATPLQQVVNALSW
jgi:hypothetical protein